MNSPKVTLLAGLLVVLLGCGARPAPKFADYDLELLAGKPSPVDLSFLLDTPAGRDGFIRAAGGHLIKPNGDRFRIWGVNLSFAGNLPDRDHAPRYADLLARFGVNCIRVHHCDRFYPSGLIDPAPGDSRHLHPEALDRLDYFISQLKMRGIYVNLNLNVSRQFQEADGVKDAELIGYAKGLTYFDPRLIELQREYARQLLTHRNPYTGNEYRHEPAIAIVEMVNENSLVEAWMRGRLRGEQATPTRATWTDIPPSYAADLTRLFNQWLRADAPQAILGALPLTPPVARLTPEEFGSVPEDRFRLEAMFYMHLEDRFFRDLGRYLKDDLGVQSLLVGTSAHASSLSPYPLLRSASQLDIADGHTYWQHPSYERDPQTGATLSFTIKNTPMVNEPAQSTMQALSRNAVAGLPYTVSEVNHPWPSEYACEGIPILAAYGALQDWDGIFLYSFSHLPPQEWKPGPAGHFDIRNDPVKMTQLAAGALVFTRGDVAAARETVKRSYSATDVIDSLRLPRAEAPFFTPGFPPLTPLVHGTRIDSFDGATSSYAPLPAGSPVISDTGELAWRLDPDGRGLVTVDTARTQAIIGHSGGQEVRLGNIRADIANNFSALVLTSLDGKPIAQSSRLLLTTGARVRATGMEWNEERTTLVQPGKAPMQIETVAGRVTLRGLEGAKSVYYAPLDGAGQPMSKGGVFGKLGEWAFRIGRTPAPWYLITVERD